MGSAESGKTYSYTPGTPDFDLEAVESVRHDTSGVDLYTRIPLSSLVFVRDGAVFAARYELRLRVFPESQDEPILDLSWIDTLRSVAPVSKGPVRDRQTCRWITIPAGEYVVEGILEDINSSARSIRRQRVSVFPATGECSVILRPRFEQKIGNLFVPFLPLQISRNVDSLRAILKVWHPDGLRERQIRVSLLRYDTDTLPSTLPFYLTPPAGSLRFLGVDFQKADTLWSASLSLVTGREDSVLLPLKALRPGFHEILVQGILKGCPGQDDGEQVVRRRDLVILDTDYPRITRLRQMCEALVYLATEKEFHAVMDAPAEEEKRKQFDNFWLRLGESPPAAANLINQYYTRTEEANRLFSSYKEGWKTDQGMVYIVFGPPQLIEHEYLTERWSYDSGRVFAFHRETARRENVPFEHWTLQRDALYEPLWEKEIGRWRRGQAF
jgi:GWxTD domain-containing protein